MPCGFFSLVQLETDPNLLIPKAQAALERYGHQVVIGNDLHRRKYEVVFISRSAKSASGFEESWLRIAQPITPKPSDPSIVPIKEIEEDIVEELVRRHQAFIDDAKL
jgi:phosphopantothenate---cysteine ligase (ATP)